MIFFKSKSKKKKKLFKNITGLNKNLFFNLKLNIQISFSIMY